MNLIKISTDLELSVHEFPTGTHEEQNNKLRELIGNDCRLYEHVMPKRLYTELHQMDHPTKVKGQCVSMLIDEEGLLKEVIISLFLLMQDLAVTQQLFMVQLILSLKIIGITL